MKSVHKTVLLNETIEGLNLQKVSSEKALVVDCTFGGGGHSAEICKRYPSVKIIAFDQDQGAFEKAKDKFKSLDCEIDFVNANFKDLEKFVSSGVDGIIFDLGLSSDQLENSGRGFSFMKDEPLLMTMKENPLPEDVTAGDVVNTWSETSLADIIYGYGEERFSRRIAKRIVDARQKAEIKTTFDLVKIIDSAVPASYKRGRIHPATKTFQALRIAVNDELGVLKIGLQSGFNILKSGGRMSVISFHSLEDRVVKRFYKEVEKEGVARLINKKPIIATSEEVKNNSRSRSAKLRVLEKK
ncbi:MAG: 16S rRNA (cytosine(1402)-N(4))-methyltransferase RsmH [Candidatus Pacebacteria bacterium]|nr:16S rRNA (cytosine(1402)-N(4))-methyltransferase RsmH [Candidatus Paceibacterota bacterium]